MGLLSEFYLSTSDDAEGYDTSTYKPNDDRAEFKGITTLELTTLWALIEEKEWEEERLDIFEEVKDENDGEITINSIPQILIETLSKLSSEKINTISPLWAETEELEWETEEAQEVIEALVKLSQKAGSGNKGLYLWNCV